MSGRISFLTALALITFVISFVLRADSRAPDSAAAWADAYTYNPSASTMYFYLDITSDSRFTLRLGGCFGTSEISRGSVAYRDGVLLFHPSKAEEFPPELAIMIPMRWNDRLYLVDAQHVDEFTTSLRTGALECIGDCRGLFFTRNIDLERVLL